MHGTSNRVGELEKVNASRVGHSSFYTMHAAVRRAAKNSDFVRVVGFCAVLAGTRTDILPTSVTFGFR